MPCLGCANAVFAQPKCRIYELSMTHLQIESYISSMTQTGLTGLSGRNFEKNLLYMQETIIIQRILNQSMFDLADFLFFDAIRTEARTVSLAANF